MKIVQRILVFLLGSVLVVTSVAAEKGSSTPSSQRAQTVEYALPYPGILPDHPLYWLKLVRDKLLDILIVDPLRKAEFYLLQADKRLGMGVALIQKGNAPLGEQTISKGEKYLAQAVAQIVSASRMGKEIPSYLMDRMRLASAKHREVLTELVAAMAGPELGGVKESLEFLKRTISEVEKLK